jgi:hypothetical protein
MREVKVFSAKPVLTAVAAALIGVFTIAGVACAEGEDGAQGLQSSRGGSPWATYYRYLEENPEIYAEADRTYPDGQTGYGKNGETEKKVPGPRIPGKIWPIVTQPHIPQGPEKTMNWAKTMDRITGYSQEPIGSVNLSPGFAALSLGVAGQMLADQLQSPQATMPRAREEQNQQVQLSADNTAAMERQQAGCAIDFVASYLYNFTVEEGNKWNQVRNRLFLPMALLLLLPGAILAQVKSIASQGFAVLGEISPFDGIVRSIIAIFMIPGTYLVVNYGIDVANSITKVVSEEYTKTFGTNMYEDAMCAHIRAFPFREPIENKNFVPNQEAKMGRLSPNNTPFAELEGNMINIKLTDPCAKLNVVPADRANEQVKYSVNAQRNAYNTANAALAMAWNILCAFQMAYLYYLWFVGPVVAALWVYPMKQLRDAFPSWCEGVITICFWSLFWSTVVLLMACFRGVDETGTVIMTALNFLATACVKFAFDFAGLVKDAGREAGRMAQRMAEGAGGKGAQGGASGHNTQQGAHGGNGAHGSNGAPGAHGAGGNGTPPSAVPPIEDGGLASAGPNGLGSFEGGLAEGAGGLGGPNSLSANGGGINGHVSMHDFPHPPLASHGHGGHGPGIVGAALGGAGLFLGLAAMAQPHFMNHGAGGVGGGDPDGGGTGVAGGGPTSNADDGKGIPVADASYDLSNPLADEINNSVAEGDLYEHNWGESALNAPIASASLTTDGPPLSSLPVGPNVSLTPDIALGLPPGSGMDSATAFNAVFGGNGADGLSGAAGINGGAGANGGAPTLVANNADGIGAVGVPGAHAPGSGGGHGHAPHDPLHVVAHTPHHVAGDHVAHHNAHHGAEHHAAHHSQHVAGDQVAHTQHHNAHHGAEHHAAHHNQHVAGDQVAHNQHHNAHHDMSTLNAMFRDSNVNVNAQSNFASAQANFNAQSNLSSTDIAYTASMQPQQNYDYSIANANAANNAYATNSTVAGGAAGSSQYVDNSVASSNSNYYDPSQAGFSALASSIAGDTVSYVDDGTVAYTDPGISTTMAAGDYSTSMSNDFTTSSYSGDAITTSYGAGSSTSYGADYSTAYGNDYGNDYSTAYGVDYSSVVDDTTVVDSSATYASASMPTNISANVTSVSNSDSYTNALSAGGFVAPPPDSTLQLNASSSSLTQQNADMYSNSSSLTQNADVYSNASLTQQNSDIYTNSALSNNNIALNNNVVDTPQFFAQQQQPLPTDMQISSSQQYYSAASQEIVMNASVQPASTQSNSIQPGSPHPAAPGAIDATVAAAGAAAMGSAFGRQPNDAAQQLRNRLAFPDGTPKQAGVNNPKNVKVTPPGGKQISHSAAPGTGKQSVLGAAVGKAGIRQAQPNAPAPRPGANQQLSRPAPNVRPSSSVGSLQESVQATNTRNRYIQPGKMSEEEQAEIEALARETGDWLPLE